MTYLTLFTIGPVQSFIAQARKFQDLYAGSYLLSHLTSQAMKQIEGISNAEVLFPKRSVGQKSTPNRFLMKIEAENEQDLRYKCEKLGSFVRNELEGISKKIFEECGLIYSDPVKNQIGALLQVYYASEEYAGGECYGKCYIDVIKRLGSAKALREFNQINEPPGRKCNLSPEYSALFYREDDQKRLNEGAQYVTYRYDIDKYLQKNEALGAVAFVKRRLKFAIPDFDDNFPSVSHIASFVQLNELEKQKPDLKSAINEVRGEPSLLFDEIGRTDGKTRENIKKILSSMKENNIKLSPYYAVIMFDGDDMGMWYSKPEINDLSKTEEFQSFLSEKISKFASENARVVVDWNSKNNGAVIYAGGEDFLGALNISAVFTVLKALREEFGSIDLKEYTTKPLTFSAGIAIAHVKTPLSAVLELARDAEHKAKKYPGKDAYCLTIAKHNGEKTEFVQPFYQNGKSGIATLESIISIIIENRVSTKFIYQLSAELARISEINNDELNEIKKDIFLIEAKRLLSHSDFPEKNKDDKERIVCEICEEIKRLTDAPRLDLKNILEFLRGIAFIARERGAV